MNHLKNSYFYPLFLLQSLIYGSAVGAISLLIPLYALELHATTLELGYIAGGRGIGHFLLVIPVGMLVDRYGVRKVFLTSSFLDFFALISFPLATNPWILLVLVLLEGLACSARLTAQNARFFRTLPFIEEYKTGWFKGAITIGLAVIGPLLGGFLGEVFGLGASFVILAAAIVAAGLIELALRDDQLLDRKESKFLFSIQQSFKLLKDPLLLFVSFTEALTSGFIAGFSIVITALLAGQLSYSTGTVSAITLILGIGTILVVFLAGSLLKRYAPPSIYLAGSLVVILGLLVLGFRDDIGSVALGSILLGGGIGLLNLVTYWQMGSIKGDHGKISGIFTFLIGVGVTLAPLLGSYTAELVDLQKSLWIFIPFFLAIGGLSYRKGNTA